MKAKVLFLMQLPPPVHGASMMNSFIQCSMEVKSQFQTRFIDVSPESKISGLGKFTLRKMFRTVVIVLSALKTFLFFRPELVYFSISPHGFAFYKDAVMVFLLKIFGAKFVFHLHGKGVADEVGSPFKLFVYKSVFKCVDVIHLSEVLYNDLGEVRDKNAEIYALGNGIPDSASPQPSNFESPVFIYLSNFIPTKGAHVLLNAINSLDEKYRGRFKLKLIGSSSSVTYQQKLKSSVEKKFPESIELMGPLYGEKKRLELEAADVFCLPTSNDCFPLSILEGMSHSLAIVSTYEGAIPSIVDDGVNGTLFDAGDENSLRNIICTYIDDYDLLHKHQKMAREKFLASYEISVFERHLCGILKEILRKRGS